MTYVRVSDARLSALGVCLGLICLLASLTQSSVSAGVEEQSFFLFKTTPALMHLSVEDLQITGETRSVWGKEYRSFIVGKVIEPDVIELGFYSDEQYWRTWQLFHERPDGEKKCTDSHSTPCYVAFFRRIESEMGIKPIQKSVFVYDANSQTWTNRETPTIANRYSDFLLESNATAESIFRGKPNVEFGRGGHPSPLHGVLFRLATTGGAASSRPIPLCGQTKDLEEHLRKSGNWEVEVRPLYLDSYSVQLKSHSDREFFYKDGYWWKAYAEISFAAKREGGNCSDARIYVYDTVVCGGPRDVDPDKHGRRLCFQRIEQDSKAEIDLRDRLAQMLQKSYEAQ